jgi:ATP-binding cassette subfamily B protein/subfamily B ATP-binding cassette protein MsbA
MLNSRIRFRDYRATLADRHGDPAASRHAAAKEIESKRQRSIWRLLAEFLGLLRGYRGAIAFALATVTVSTVLKLIPPAATKIAIDYAIGGKPLPSEGIYSRLPSFDRWSLLVALAAGVLAVSLLENLVHLWGRWYATKTVQRVRVSMRRRLFDHVLRLPLHRVYQLKSGGLASMLREDAASVADLVFTMLYNPWSAVIQLTGSLIVLAYVDWRLLLGCLVLLPMIFLTHRTWIGRIRPLYRDIHRQRQDIDGQATETFGGMRVVRAFGRQRSESNRFVRNNDFMSRQELYVWWWSRLIGMVWEVLMPIASAALLLYGGSLILQGELTLGDLTMFLFYLAMLIGPLAVLATSATQFQSGLAGLERMLDLLAEEREMPASSEAIAVRPEEVRGRVTFRNVSFHYPGSKTAVLQNINLDVKPGQTIALVGRSGAGKTTLCNLVARFYDPAAGAIELDGRDLRTIQVESYRRLLGVVEQDVFLFDGTVAENIGYAARHASQGAIEEAARIAHAHEFIVQLEQGYDTIIGERGVRLSGGQRQRLAIARAVLADPRILILDEATSNLDSESERLIQRSLASLMQGRTSFVIAHRLSTIIHADQIIVLEEGRILEAGTHVELLRRGGRYHEMVELQVNAGHMPVKV